MRKSVSCCTKSGPIIMLQRCRNSAYTHCPIWQRTDTGGEVGWGPDWGWLTKGLWLVSDPGVLCMRPNMSRQLTASVILRVEAGGMEHRHNLSEQQSSRDCPVRQLFWGNWLLLSTQSCWFVLCLLHFYCETLTLGTSHWRNPPNLKSLPFTLTHHKRPTELC